MSERIEAALDGKLPERPDTEWTDATSAQTEQDYRQLQAQYDQLQSKYKAVLDALQLARDNTEWCSSEELERIDAALAGQVPEPAVPEGWQLVPVEPTNDMLDASYFNNHSANKCIYKAVLAAAPKPDGAT